MTAEMWGAVLGGSGGFGVLLVGTWALSLRRTQLSVRVLPYLRDLPQTRTGAGRSGERLSRPTVAALAPLLLSAAGALDNLLGGSSSVRRRIERANLGIEVRDFRVEQVTWGLVAFAASAALSLLVAPKSPGGTVPLLVLCGASFVLGVLLRENRLSTQVARRERRILAEFPAVAELLALAVAAGEGPVSALDRVVRRCHGPLAEDLTRVLADVRTGTPVNRALDDLASRSGLPVVARFADGMAVAVERGTPLADVLHAQAADVREARRRALLESGARKEVLMMVPVVFLVLPVTVLFAFWPGVVGLRLVTP